MRSVFNLLSFCLIKLCKDVKIFIVINVTKIINIYNT